MQKIASKPRVLNCAIIFLMMMATSFSWAAQLPQHRMPQPTHHQPGRLLVLKNGEVLRGRIRQEPDKYILDTLQGSRLVFQAERVELICDSLKDAYWEKCARTKASDVIGQKKLFYWCVKHDLIEEAQNQINLLTESKIRASELVSLDRQLNATIDRLARKHTKPTLKPNSERPLAGQVKLAKKATRGEAVPNVKLVPQPSGRQNLMPLPAVRTPASVAQADSVGNSSLGSEALKPADYTTDIASVDTSVITNLPKFDVGNIRQKQLASNAPTISGTLSAASGDASAWNTPDWDLPSPNQIAQAETTIPVDPLPSLATVEVQGPAKRIAKNTDTPKAKDPKDFLKVDLNVLPVGFNEESESNVLVRSNENKPAKNNSKFKLPQAVMIDDQGQPIHPDLEIHIPSTGSNSRPERDAATMSTAEIEKELSHIPKLFLGFYRKRVEKLYTNGCSAAKCHESNAVVMPLMQRSRAEAIPKAMSVRNFYQISHYINLDDPFTSPALIAAIEPHAGNAKPIFEEGSKQHDQLIRWFEMIGERPVAVESQPDQEPKPLDEAEASLSKPGDEAKPGDGTNSGSSIDGGSLIGEIPDLNEPKSTFQPVDPFDPEIFNRMHHGG